MGKIIRNNQVIITALAIMIAIAGYLNYSSNNNEEETYGKIYQALEEGGTKDDAKQVGEWNVGENSDIEKSTEQNKEKNKEKKDDKKIDKKGSDNSNEKQKENSEKKDIDVKEKTTKNEDNKKESDVKETQKSAMREEKDSNVGDAVLVNSTINLNYFYTVKLEREQTRAKSQETLMKVVDSASVNEQQKQAAVDEIIKLTSNAEMEEAAEILLEAKGFENTVVSMVDNSVDVVVEAETLTDEQVAQIQDIVKRKTKVDASKIVITPVKSSKK